MTTHVLSAVLAAGLLLAACNPAPEASAPAPASQSGPMADPATIDGPGSESRSELAALIAAEPDEDGLSALDRIAERACNDAEADPAALLPMGSSFASRGPDGLIRIACAFEGRRENWQFNAAEMPDVIRMPFDMGVANHLRAGTFPQDDRSLSGLYRRRDGGMCAVQTRPEIARGVCDAARTAQDRSDGAN